MQGDELKRYAAERMWGLKHAQARRRYNHATPLRYYLPDAEFEAFARRYQHIPAAPALDYSPEAADKRAHDRAQQLLAMAQTVPEKALEIGPGDGMVLKHLLDSGCREAIGVDLENKINPAAQSAGVRLLHQNAEDLSDIPSQSQDLVFSYSAFEHIGNVHRAFQECVRILKPGGGMYHSLGPLYYSPWGYHYYATLKAPYIHILFSPGALRAYALSRGIQPPWVGPSRFRDYLAIVRGLPHDFQVERFERGYDWFSSDLIIRYPGLFRAKSVEWEDFFIDHATLVIRRAR